MNVPRLPKICMNDIISNRGIIFIWQRKASLVMHMRLASLILEDLISRDIWKLAVKNNHTGVAKMSVKLKGSTGSVCNMMSRGWLKIETIPLKAPPIYCNVNHHARLQTCHGKPITMRRILLID